MDAEGYINILRIGLLPFLQEKLPRLMQDNDPKHTSRAARQFMEEEGVNWWKTPPKTQLRICGMNSKNTCAEKLSH